MCQLSCRRVCWTRCDPYEKQLLMAVVQNASFVGGLHGCMAMVLVWRRRSHVASERWRMACCGQAMAMARLGAQRPYDSWFELIVEACLNSNGIET